LLGGIARRVTYVEKKRAEGRPVVVVESGDLFFDIRESGDSQKALTKARLLGRAYRRMGAVAVNVGDQDLLQGMDFLRQESSKGLPLISTNLLDSSRKTPIFPPYLVKETSGVRIAFFGLLPPGLRPAIQNGVGEKVLIKDPMPTAQEIVPKLRGRADIIVLLSDLGMEMDRVISRAVPGIHFILGGNERRLFTRSIQQGKTYIFQSYEKGMYVGKLSLIIRNPTSPFQDKLKPDQILREIDGLDRRIRTLQRDRDRQPQQNIDQAIQFFSQQKARLEEELRKARDYLASGNYFLWTMELMDMMIPEHQEIKEWIAEAGVEQD
jgi:2',3'-cyclic-nucleotide 2'-phosphodiesterase (5'-nucleotidase family)